MKRQRCCLHSHTRSHSAALLPGLCSLVAWPPLQLTWGTLLTIPGEQAQLHYIVTDHAGTPQELCTPEGRVEWEGSQNLWGRYQQQSQRPQARTLEEERTHRLTCELRYQGQIEDEDKSVGSRFEQCVALAR